MSLNLSPALLNRTRSPALSLLPLDSFLLNSNPLTSLPLTPLLTAGGPCEHLLKWKPPHLNSVDFRFDVVRKGPAGAIAHLQVLFLRQLHSSSPTFCCPTPPASLLQPHSSSLTPPASASLLQPHSSSLTPPASLPLLSRQLPAALSFAAAGAAIANAQVLRSNNLVLFDGAPRSNIQVCRHPYVLMVLISHLSQSLFFAM